MSASKPSKVEAQYWHPTGFVGLYARVFLRTTQFLLALILIGLYAPDLTNATSTSSQAQAAWIVVIIACIFSVLTCIVHVFITVKRVALVCTWDSVLMVVWAAMTGTFGVMYTGHGRSEAENETTSFTTDRTRMEVAVWFDLLMMLLWGLSAFQGCVWCCVARRVTRKTVVPGKDGIAQNEEDRDLETGSAEDGRNETNRALDLKDFKEGVNLHKENNTALLRGIGDDEWKTLTMGGQALKKMESPPPSYARFSV